MCPNWVLVLKPIDSSDNESWRLRQLPQTSSRATCLDELIPAPPIVGLIYFEVEFFVFLIPSIVEHCEDSGA